MPKPWTQDKVFQRSFFCNVFRRIDKTTVWIMDNVAGPLADDDNLWAMLMLARYISCIDCLEDLKDHGTFTVDKTLEERLVIARELMLRRQNCGQPVYTNAFMLNSQFGGLGPTKAHYITNVIRKLAQDQFVKEIDGPPTMKRPHTVLMQYPSIGTFMAYQYCCDFSYIDKYLAQARDTMTWSAPGVGSSRGMCRILGLPVSSNMNNETWLLAAQELLHYWRNFVDHTLLTEALSFSKDLDADQCLFVSSSYALFTELKMQDVQHWLCEYDKYKRGGSTKRNYNGVN